MSGILIINPVSFLISIPFSFAFFKAASMSGFKISLAGILSILNGNEDCWTFPSASPQLVAIPAKWTKLAFPEASTKALAFTVNVPSSSVHLISSIIPLLFTTSYIWACKKYSTELFFNIWSITNFTYSGLKDTETLPVDFDGLGWIFVP